MDHNPIRLDQLTFFHFLAAVAIVIFHCVRDNTPFNEPSISYLFDEANKWMSYFFLLFGLGMIIAYQNRANIVLWRCMKNRKVLKNIYQKLSFRKVVILIVGFWIVSPLIIHALIASDFSERTHFWHYFPVLHLNEFLLGNLGGMVIFRWSKWHHENFDIPILLLAVMLALVLKFQLNLNYHNRLLAIILLPLIMLLSFNNGYITRLFRLKPLVFLGEISYEVYILQFPVRYWVSSLPLETYFGIAKVSSLKFYVKRTILIAMAGLSYKFIESILRNKIKKLTFKKNSFALLEI